MEETRRSTRARLGIAALNLLAPGLGLLRLGRGRDGLVWLGISAAVMIGLLLLYAWGPEPGFVGYAAIMSVALVTTLTVPTVAMIQSWRASSRKAQQMPWWTRWYALVAYWLVVTLLGQAAIGMAHYFYKPFYAPTESMTPTIGANDHYLVNMRSREPLRRGEVVVFVAGSVDRIDRIAALPGDRIAIHNGVPIVNGQPATQHFVGNLRYAGFDGTDSVRRLEERLPGEAGSHFILDLGTLSETDEMAELWVPPGHVFVLGDNRNRAADSRVPLYMNGVGLPALDDIRGRPLFIWWSGDHSRIGALINP